MEIGVLGPIPAALASGSEDSIGEIVTAAVTAEALAVTYLTSVIESASNIGIPGDLVPVLKAANATEYDHYKTLRSLSAKAIDGEVLGTLRRRDPPDRGRAPGVLAQAKLPNNVGFEVYKIDRLGGLVKALRKPGSASARRAKGPAPSTASTSRREARSRTSRATVPPERQGGSPTNDGVWATRLYLRFRAHAVEGRHEDR